jgi:hypothetical protein
LLSLLSVVVSLFKWNERSHKLRQPLYRQIARKNHCVLMVNKCDSGFSKIKTRPKKKISKKCIVPNFRFSWLYWFIVSQWAARLSLRQSTRVEVTYSRKLYIFVFHCLAGEKVSPIVFIFATTANNCMFGWQHYFLNTAPSIGVKSFFFSVVVWFLSYYTFNSLLMVFHSVVFVVSLS